MAPRHQTWARSTRILAATSACLLFLALTGCGRAPATPAYEILSGRISLCKPDTGELIVHVEDRSDRANREHDVPCQLTRDTELYINDRLAAVEELKPGDVIELIGYHDANASIARFVVSTGNITREESPDAPPIEKRETP